MRHPAAGITSRIRVDYPFGSPNTEGAVRLRHGAEVVFVKLLRGYRHWPLIGTLPPALRDQALASPLWHYEADVYSAGVGKLLPDGLRLPVVHAVIDLGTDRMAVVMENVEVTPAPWDAGRFARAARRLGRMNALLTRHDALPPTASRSPGYLTGLHYASRLQVAELPALADARTWEHPLLAPHTALRSALDRLAGHLPAVIARLATLPHLMVHGDFSPQNLLVPADRPDEFVVIDWSMGGLAAAGDDLGQLLVGLAHAGMLGAGDLPALHEILLTAYAQGLADEGAAVPEADLRYGFDGGLLLRSAFTALPLERLGEPLTTDLAELVEARLALTAYLCDLGPGLVPGPQGRTGISC
ncbi:phosphotransferase [Jidongwangia harbinensis]|uniref:phosphotransferase n=1 Tax=Jidongwangia harbinensis TaxID=2878561 RepID=UPI001CDA0B16|nr:phosphotransferase [Jidongwangia harbinensis]MCA2214335.1 phosphotransferase [Jidongwangia harbinensis]